MSVFDSPLLLGFEPFEQLLDRVAKSAQESYPPYNIEQLDETQLRVTLAVAGFAEDDLSVTVDGNQLMIRGRQSEASERVFLHRGIAARQFQRNFVLADGLEVAGARLETGLLHIEINRPLPETTTRTIKIESDPTPPKAPKLKAVGNE
jgi:HSP20 family molecular chaperone IbpA